MFLCCDWHLLLEVNYATVDFAKHSRPRASFYERRPAWSTATTQWRRHPESERWYDRVALRHRRLSVFPPTVAGDVLLIGSCAGTFYAFDKRSGKVRWSYDIHQDGNQTSFHGNPLITDQLVLIGTDNGCASGGIGHVYAFDRATGAVRWKYRALSFPGTSLFIKVVRSLERKIDERLRSSTPRIAANR